MLAVEPPVGGSGVVGMACLLREVRVCGLATLLLVPSHSPAPETKSHVKAHLLSEALTLERFPALLSLRHLPRTGKGRPGPGS